jgi:hypothetical protein
MPDLVSLAEEVARTRTPRVLQRGDEEVAVRMPLRAPRRSGKRVTQAEIVAARATFGAWKGHIDAEQLKRDIKSARSDHRY